MYSVPLCRQVICEPPYSGHRLSLLFYGKEKACRALRGCAIQGCAISVYAKRSIFRESGLKIQEKGVTIKLETNSEFSETRRLFF